jgi:hypothetical protein
MRMKLLRLLRIAPLALLFAGVASAQTSGTIIGVITDASTGKPVAGAVVIATSPNLQGQQTSVTDPTGGYRLSLLPPGEYALTVQLGGYKDASRADIRLSQDKTIRANMAVVPEAVQMEEQVVRTGAAPVVNVGSAESGAVVSKEFISSIPIARGFEQVAAVAPTARADFYGVSFAGAQSPENQYIVDGLNTTDPTFGTRTTLNGPPALRTNFLEEIDVKTGSFSAEYGRATGGILNAVLKSGSNEYHGSVFSAFTPSFLVEPKGIAVGSAGEALAYRSTPSNGTYALDLGFELGGPILKDKLWFYAGVAPIIQKTYYERFVRRNALSTDAGGCPAGFTGTPDPANPTAPAVCADEFGNTAQTTLPGLTQDMDTWRNTYQYVGKLTYLLNETNSFTVSAWGAPSNRQTLRQGFTGGPGYNSASARYAYVNDGQTAINSRWAGKFLDKRLIGEVQLGWYGTYNTPQDKTVQGLPLQATPTIEWNVPMALTNFEAAPGCTSDLDCPVTGYQTGGSGGIFDWTTNRYNAKATASYLFEGLGQHNVRAGVDLERVQYDIKKLYSGGAYYNFLGATATRGPIFNAFRGYGEIIGPDGQPLTRTTDVTNVRRTSPGNESETDSFGYFVQDSWQFAFLPNVTVNYGLRLETQSMRNLDFTDSTGFKINDNWSPRLQAIWDFTGNGRGKAAASWGRFYYAMPLDMGDRAFGREISLRYSLNPTSCGAPADFANGAAGSFDPRNLNIPGQPGTTCALNPGAGGATPVYSLTGAPLTPADPNLKGQFVDQFGGVVEYEVFSDLSVGLDYQGRRQGNVIEDMSSNDAASYFIGNPGRDSTFADPNSPTGTSNSKNVTAIDAVTGRNINIQFPSPERSYDGLTFRATKAFSRNWLAQASYTLATLRGNYAGPYRPEDTQLDPGITSEYDLAALMANKKGYLPGDQRHQLKLFGAYTFNLGPRFNVTASGAYNGSSGTPVNALGGGTATYGSSQAFIIPRGQGGRTPFTNTFDLGAGVGYTIRPPVALNVRLDVFNVFNAQETLSYDEDLTFDVVQPITGMNCSGRNSAGKGQPIQALLADCPDLAYLKTADGRPVTYNQNWGKTNRTTTAIQAPLSLRFSVALTF